MAKGNIGNLLQHFIGLRAAKSVVEDCNNAEIPIEYIDCYSMAPWEGIEGNQPQGFVEQVNSFPQKQQDFVSRAFLHAWSGKYRGEMMPLGPRDRVYPNTAVLLRVAFPNQRWRMRLHEIDDGKRQRLQQWAEGQGNGGYSVGGDWNNSELIREPAPTDRPVFVMLDPFQLVRRTHSNADQIGNLNEDLLRYLIGAHALNLANAGDRQPVVVTLFSYSQANPGTGHQIVQERFNGEQWTIDRVCEGPWQGQGNQRLFHQGWIVSRAINTPVLGEHAQGAWDNWKRLGLP